LFRLQTIARSAGYVDTLFYLLKAAMLQQVLAPAAVVNPSVGGNKGNKRSGAAVKKDQQKANVAARNALVKSIHETFRRTAEIQLLKTDYALFEKTWTVPYVTGRLHLAEWMQGTPMTVHVHTTCTCYPYDANA
jgi:hypothetical protein